MSDESVRILTEKLRFSSLLKKENYFEVSSGTLRPQDLIPKFLLTLEFIGPKAYEQLQTLPFQLIPSHALEDDDADFWTSDKCLEAMETLVDSLDEWAPPGFTFGSHEGDGSLFGFWPLEAM